jgi:glycosyltransferase involved in cell wall biosynthesis
LVAQTVPPTEIIVIDDASTDDSVDVIEDFAARHRTVQLIKNSSNIGAYNSENRAFAEAKGDYIYLMSADDKVLPGFFEKSITLLEKYTAAGMCANYPKYIDALGNPIKSTSFHSHESDVNIRSPRFLSTTEVLSRLSKQPWFLSGAVPVLFRRSALPDTGCFIPGLGLLSDWFTVHFVALKYGICYIPEPLVAFRMMPSGLGTDVVVQPKVAIEDYARALCLMQEPKYRQVFPKSFIDKKKGEFSYSCFRGALVLWQTNFLQELNNLAPPQSLHGKGLMWLLRMLMRFQWLMLKIYCHQNIPQVFRDK